MEIIMTAQSAVSKISRNISHVITGNLAITAFEATLTLSFAVGFYMTVMTSNSTQPEVAQLLTPELTSATEMCVRFW